jgi:hypothetical protein
LNAIREAFQGLTGIKVYQSFLGKNGTGTDCRAPPFHHSSVRPMHLIDEVTKTLVRHASRWNNASDTRIPMLSVSPGRTSTASFDNSARDAAPWWLDHGREVSDVHAMEGFGRDLERYSALHCWAL